MPTLSDGPEDYDRLVKTGAIGSFKRDILLEASRDIEYLDSILSWFLDKSGIEKSEAARSSARIVVELVAKGLCQLSTWDPEKNHQHQTKSSEELIHIINSLDSHPFEFFLVSTQAGDSWIERYRELVDEL